MALKYIYFQLRNVIWTQLTIQAKWPHLTVKSAFLPTRKQIKGFFRVIDVSSS